MKKLLIASTALSLAGGAAFAEMAVTVGGSAELGLDYNSEAGEGMSKHKFVHDFGVTFEGSGTTDGGLSFSASAGFDNTSDGGSFDDGSVSVSGSFGTLSIGDVARGIDMAGGIDDIGMNGIGVDDMVEDLREGTAKQIRYENNFGQISIAISAGTKEGMAGTPENPASVWSGIGPDKMETVWIDLDDPATFKAEAAFDGLYNISRTVSDKGVLESVVNVADGTVGSDSIVGYGYRVDADGEFVLDGDDNKIVVTDPTEPIASQTLADDVLLGAFNRYAQAYNLGDDNVVGGEDVAADPDDEDSKAQKNADTRKDGLLADNYMAEVPAVKSETQYAFGMNFETGGVTIGVGYDSEKTVSMGAGFSTGEISTKLLFVKTDEEHAKGERTGMGVDLSYSMGASKVTLAYGRDKPEEGEAMDAVGMGVTHDLGGGATLNAGFGKVDMMDDDGMIVSQNKASIGLMFAF